MFWQTQVPTNPRKKKKKKKRERKRKRDKNLATNQNKTQVVLKPLCRMASYRLSIKLVTEEGKGSQLKVLLRARYG